MTGKALQQRSDDGRTGRTEMYCEVREEDCSPISEKSRLIGESFTKEVSPERDTSSVADSP